MLIIDNTLLPPALYIVSTPIGNLKDITLRALIILKNSNLIACEDTRITKKLLSAYKIKFTNLLSIHDHTPESKLKSLIQKIKEGKSVALVSDAGTPIISDPGYELVVLALKENLTIVPIPGPSAITTSLVASGLNSEKFFFAGFLPSKKNKRIKELKNLIKIDSLLIFYESPKRLEKTILDMILVFGNRKCVIAREMTKYYETFYRGDLEKFKKIDKDLKGEITIILSKSENKKNTELNSNIEDNKYEKIMSILKGKISTKDLSNLLSLIYKKPKRFFYTKLIKNIK